MTRAVWGEAGTNSGRSDKAQITHLQLTILDAGLCIQKPLKGFKQRSGKDTFRLWKHHFGQNMTWLETGGKAGRPVRRLQRQSTWEMVTAWTKRDGMGAEQVISGTSTALQKLTLWQKPYFTGIDLASENSTWLVTLVQNVRLTVQCRKKSLIREPKVKMGL